MEVVARLEERGVTVNPTDDGGELATLLESVERFERAVERHGGDLMVDDLRSSAPDDRHFVVPRREPEESLRNYIGRIDRARVALRRHPDRAD